MAAFAPATLSGDAAAWRGASLCSVTQFTEAGLDLVLRRAEELRLLDRGAARARHAGAVLANVFYEPSTRTSCSFQAAMLRLGGSVICVAESTSSAKKGETPRTRRDPSAATRTSSCCATRRPARRPAPRARCRRACRSSTPATASASTRRRRARPLHALPRAEPGGAPALPPRACLKGKTVVLVGDLKHGRTVHSLAKMLAAFDVAFVFVAPPELAMPAGVAAAVDAGTATRAEAPSLAAALVDADALYVTRVQKERFPDAAAYEAVRGSYVVDAQLMKTAKPSCAVLHPLPRVDEISADFDSDPRAAYFRQMRNGLSARMALLDLVL
ncbi:carbamoyl-phosphate synthase [Aureococcus anophagefferens]|nr:carbamoyl-phosphate synthase [Aureococcus anophagefferens]